MTDLIDRRAVRLIESDANAYTEEWNDDYEKGFTDALNKVIALPSAQPERRTGNWTRYIMWKCSECDRRFDEPYHFCPNCGADMIGGE